MYAYIHYNLSILCLDIAPGDNNCQLQFDCYYIHLIHNIFSNKLYNADVNKKYSESDLNVLKAIKIVSICVCVFM